MNKIEKKTKIHNTKYEKITKNKKLNTNIHKRKITKRNYKRITEIHRKTTKKDPQSIKCEN